MTTAKVYLVTGLLTLLISSMGCGQKGPLYLDKTSNGAVKRVNPEDAERRKELEGFQQRNDSQPDITY